jgi:Glycosyl transferases group 1
MRPARSLGGHIHGPLRRAERLANRLRQPGRIDYFQALAREGLWRARPDPVIPLRPSWFLDPEALELARIRWPTVYDWSNAGRWVDTLVAGLNAHTQVDLAELPQPYRNIVMIEVWLNGRRHDVAIDYADRSHIDEAARRNCDLYFKMQFLAAGYDDEAIIPGGFPPSWPSLYRYVGHLRRVRSSQKFTTDVYGRFSAVYAAETRRRAVELLREQKRFQYGGGFEMVRYSAHLNEVAKAKICIDLPGKGDFCFRLIDYLAVGSCVIGPRPSTILHAPLTEGVNVVYCADDLSDLVALCAVHLEREEVREKIAQAARVHFDRYLERTQWAAYYLHAILARLGA